MMDEWGGKTFLFFPLFSSVRYLTKSLLVPLRAVETPRRGVSTIRAVSQRGFTLIEIMVVVFILGLL
ncbi:MAG TPA: prepilin-type N-terminal cleavage/methylation domain-containing protein, partial [Candidatus Binatia bacterium]|nr:prepilin-type N-terminal cleavage/methylation domain-containing protein [Candidatus Binatia bacterium]